MNRLTKLFTTATVCNFLAVPSIQAENRLRFQGMIIDICTTAWQADRGRLEISDCPGSTGNSLDAQARIPRLTIESAGSSLAAPNLKAMHAQAERNPSWSYKIVDVQGHEIEAGVYVITIHTP
ncbi:hypothetical protein G7009_07520 [Pseudomonas capeferrum]|uniref:hypothetical protein n=1 Tax=Pseudomonas capeferrum TaxID=1495066 RepID=UPI0015E45484|nr:hypothetical protein [Pseudomonas capeferrum]MBA1201610.1 hypothetical protein [Pseudomonas capeferrum]